MKKTILSLASLALLVGCINEQKNEVKNETHVDTTVVANVEPALPDNAVSYLDSVPVVKINIDSIVLPNNKLLGTYKKELEAKYKTTIQNLPIDKSHDLDQQLSQLFIKLFQNADALVDDTKHEYKKGAADEPKQNGLGYNYASRDYTGRKKMYAASCTLKVHALDCSGFLYHVFHKNPTMNQSAAVLSQTATLNTVITSSITGATVKDKGKIASSGILAGDIVYWSKIDGDAGSHIGIALKMANGTVGVFQSNGSSSDCEKNLVAGRGPRFFPLNDSYWFDTSDCDWKVLRFQK